MTTHHTSDLGLYRSEGFAEDLLDADDTQGMAGPRWSSRADARPTSSISRHGAALLCAVPLGAAVLAVTASAWGWMI